MADKNPVRYCPACAAPDLHLQGVSSPFADGFDAYCNVCKWSGDIMPDSMTHDTDVEHVTAELAVFLRPGEDGWIVAECPAIIGCFSQGRDRAEALANIREAIAVSMGAQGAVERLRQGDR